MTPAWQPVKERAVWPRLAIAIASSAIEMRSPAVSSMSSSRAGRDGRHLLGQVEQLVGGVAHRGDDDARRRGRPCLVGDDPLRDPLDALGVGDGGAAVLLHDDAHGAAPSADPRRGPLRACG